MKKILFSIFLISSLYSFAQIEVSPMVGYFFGGRTNFYEGSLKIKDNVNYGLYLGYDTDNHTGLELSYAMSSSVAQWRPSFAFSEDLPSRDFDMNTHVFLLGGIKSVPFSEKVVGFGGLKAGAILYHPREVQINDVWRFLVAVNAGVKIFLTEKVGIRLQGNLYMPMYFNGAGMYCGIGSGGSSCGASVNSTIVIFEGDLTAGLIFKLGE